MRYLSLTICETAIIDARSNNISYINCIEEIHAHSFPISIPQITAVALFERENGKDEEIETVEIVANINDTEILRQPMQANFRGRLRTRQIFVMPGFPISTAGKLKYLILHNGKPVMENSINVKSTQDNTLAKARGNGISLHPLNPKEALRALLETKPPPKETKEGKKQ